MASSFLELGQLVANPAHPEWGIGQVQSIIGERVTVNFEHQGKLVINSEVIILEEYFEDEQ